ncbi:hypothetical protein [Caballeronia sp. ATUFL_M2_KS44]|uniref:hypothetical protein n=1 Tax=Caballeronia sp. ATUFL_M2_KS44 TaxID=2921767 RepID=UPI0020276DB2|nr:hypothetical protein [Caballeronia sp. ATUFL_M2_KS44]
MDEAASRISMDIEEASSSAIAVIQGSGESVKSMLQIFQTPKRRTWLLFIVKFKVRQNWHSPTDAGDIEPNEIFTFRDGPASIVL